MVLSQFRKNSDLRGLNVRGEGAHRSLNYLGDLTFRADLPGLQPRTIIPESHSTSLRLTTINFQSILSIWIRLGTISNNLEIFFCETVQNKLNPVF